VQPLCKRTLCNKCFLLEADMISRMIFVSWKAVSIVHCVLCCDVIVASDDEDEDDVVGRRLKDENVRLYTSLMYSFVSGQ